MTLHPALVRSRTGVLVADGLGGLALLVAVVLLGTSFGSGDAAAGPETFAALVVSAVIMAAAVAVRRLHPGWALALAWVSSLAHMITGLDAGVTQLGILVVLASAAHYGSPAVLRLSGASVPVGAVIALAYLLLIDSWLVRLFSSTSLLPLWLPVGVLAALIALVLAVPWLVGLLARTMRLGREGRQRAAEAEAEARRSRELAELQSARTQLTRDVHDIVGHSLAVIVAQAESVRFRDDAEVEAMRSAVATIADTARRALGEVRHVLESTDAARAASSAPVVDLDRLIAEVADSRPGTLIARTGSAPAPQGAAAVALYRATQELLTNALRHGDPAAPLRIAVDRSAPMTAVQVENDRGPADAADRELDAARTGTGLDGARARLAAVGGGLDAAEVEGRFVARATVPLGEGEP
jgi:signal transduction histidine kinase